MEQKRNEDPVRSHASAAMNDLPDKYFNEEGDLDLRKVTAKEASLYLQKIGW